MEIPKENLDKLKCSLCNKYLSCFPVKLTNDQQSICGRCSDAFPDTTTLRITTYELIAERMRFPCSFDGCTFTLSPDEVVQHELICTYRKFNCLLQKNCNFYGNNEEFYQHCTDEHATLILQKFEFEVNATNTYEQNNLLDFKEKFLIVKRSFDKTTKLLTCSVVSINDNLYNYQMSITNGKRDKTVDFDVKTIENFTTTDNPTKIRLDDVLEQLNHPTILIATIRITDRANDDEYSNLPVHEDLLKDLECPVCLDYMLPPIKLCESGHSICETCLQSIQQCPLCRAALRRDQRNRTLESMAERLNFPCKYKERGCKFVSNLNNMRQHQQFCKFTPKNCLIADYIKDCVWTGLDEQLSKHISEQHLDNNVFNNRIDMFVHDDFFKEEFSTCYVLNFMGYLFKIHHLYKENRFYWAMQLNGVIDQIRFKYEIDFIDNTDKGLKMVLTDYCTSLTGREQCFQDGNRFIFVELSQIERFVSDNTLSYRIRIFK